MVQMTCVIVRVCGKFLLAIRTLTRLRSLAFGSFSTFSSSTTARSRG